MCEHFSCKMILVKNKPLILFCESDHHSDIAVRILAKYGDQPSIAFECEPPYNRVELDGYSDGVIRNWYIEHKASVDKRIIKLAKKIEPFYADYEAKHAPLYADYQAKRDALDADYQAKRAPLYADYQAKRDALYADYKAKRAPLDADYEAKRAPLDADYQAKRDALYADYEAKLATIDGYLAPVKE